jgi:hypothetical protein
MGEMIEIKRAKPNFVGKRINRKKTTRGARGHCWLNAGK